MNTDNILFEEISALIEQTRRLIYSQAGKATIYLFWQIGQRFNDDILQNKRADYGKQIVSPLAIQLTAKHTSVGRLPIRR
jgi:hypothetical protein